MQDRKSLNLYIQDSIRDNWELLALTDFNGISLQYRDIARKIAKLHIVFEHAKIKRGDKIAICGRNSAHWAVCFLATVTYGAVAVPILHDFHPDSIHHLVTHSDSRLFFCDADIWQNLDPKEMPHLEGAVLISDYTLLLARNKELIDTRAHLNELFGRKYPDRFTRDDVVYYEEKPEELAVINYTSGSTGFSKGVMLPYRALWSNLQYSIDKLKFLKPGDGVVCMLPLAHMYGLMFDMIHCLVKGCHLYFLTRLPSPAIILKAFAEVKPKFIVCVPLIIEKIIKNKVFPMLDKPLMKIMLKVPFVDDKLLAKIKAKLTDTFGGNLQELIIGGAGLNKDVESFLRRIKFPFTVGYGMTECAPLITYAPWDVQKPASCGQFVDRMEGRVESDDPVNKPGVLWVRGDNVMLGYYKNQDATDAVFKDGWMNTGDICSIDEDGYLYIRGRDKNMLLGPNGQNIYPEEIEQVLNNLPYVSECLVVSDPETQQLEALVYPDFENAEKQGMSRAEVNDIMEQNLKALNAEMPAYSKVSKIVVMDQEFEKTPKRSIKRYLYQK